VVGKPMPLIVFCFDWILLELPTSFIFDSLIDMWSVWRTRSLSMWWGSF
jgi:hypothetical protein